MLTNRYAHSHALTHTHTHTHSFGAILGITRLKITSKIKFDLKYFHVLLILQYVL